MYAVIETGGKQYKVEAKDVLFIEKLEAEDAEKVTFDNVVLLNTGKAIKTGKPYVKGASVDATVLKNGKSKKITVFTYKRRKNQKRKLGHRQPYTKVEINKINATSKTSEKASE